VSDTALTSGERIAWVDDLTQAVEDTTVIDKISPVVEAAARPFNRRPMADVLRGTWLGHALHPLLTDFPLGCWTSALLLDLLPGRNRRASRALIALGLLAVPPTAAAGLAEWETLNRAEERRVATVHALGNTVVAGLFLKSWLDRGRGRQVAGVGWGMLGGLLAVATGYLGGHLSFARLVGTGHRGRPTLGLSGRRLRREDRCRAAADGIGRRRQRPRQSP